MQKLTPVRRAEAGVRQTHGGQAALPNARVASPWLERALARALIRGTGNLPMRVQVGGGPVESGSGPIVAMLRLRDVPTLLKLLLYPDLNFGEGYLDGSIEVEGNLLGLLEAQARARLRARGKGTLSRLAAAALQMTRSNTLAGSR